MTGPLDQKIFEIVAAKAAKLNVKAFVIGGYVRDHLLQRESTDIDIVVEGSGIELAEAVAKELHTSVTVFRNFGTAMLKYEGIELEFVGARRESIVATPVNPLSKRVRSKMISCVVTLPSMRLPSASKRRIMVR